MRALALAIIAAAALFLAGCSEPIPLEKMAYAGDWRARDMRLLITPDGRCEYRRRREGGNTSSISAPIVRFEGDNFVVGLGLLSTTFVVSKPPHLANGRWRMIVDGVELTRVASFGEVRT